jgi:hypothetical protein
MPQTVIRLTRVLCVVAACATAAGCGTARQHAGRHFWQRSLVGKPDGPVGKEPDGLVGKEAAPPAADAAPGLPIQVTGPLREPTPAPPESAPDSYLRDFNERPVPQVPPAEIEPRAFPSDDVAVGPAEPEDDEEQGLSRPLRTSPPTNLTHPTALQKIYKRLLRRNAEQPTHGIPAGQPIAAAGRPCGKPGATGQATDERFIILGAVPLASGSAQIVRFEFPQPVTLGLPEFDEEPAELPESSTSADFGHSVRPE